MKGRTKGKKKRGTSSFSPRTHDPIQAHRDGQEPARRGFQYECTLRCLWLLKLRGTSDQITLIHDEDYVLTKTDGTVIYRQVKKKEGDRPWQFSDKDFAKFLRRAYSRFQDDNRVRHEFHTNQYFASKAFLRGNGTKRLDPHHAEICKAFPKETEAFCASVSLKNRFRELDSNFLKLYLMSAIKDCIQSVYPHSRVLDLLSESELQNLPKRLLDTEFTLFSMEGNLSWKDIDYAIGFDELISEMELRSLAGGKLISWAKIAKAPTKCLPSEAAKALVSMESIPRPSEEEVWTQIINAVAQLSHSGTCPLRLILLIGSHGSGKTWTLFRLARRLAEEEASVHVCVADHDATAAWDDFAQFGLALSGPKVVFIDEVFGGWNKIISRPASFLPDSTLFVGTASADSDAPELLELRGELGQEMAEITLPAALDDDELDALAITLRGLGPTRRELAQGGHTNIRYAVQILSGSRSPGNHLAELVRLLDTDPTLWEAIRPVFFCTNLGIRIPCSLLHEYLGRAFPSQLQTWVVNLQRQGNFFLMFEDAKEAGSLLCRHFGEATDTRTEGLFACCDSLVELVDPLKTHERAFGRYLFWRLAKRNADLCGRLINSRKRQLAKLLPHEPLWALAFIWLPTFGSHVPQLREATARSFSSAPKTAAEFTLWMEAWGGSAGSSGL